jgi:hypothetical protein
MSNLLQPPTTSYAVRAFGSPAPFLEAASSLYQIWIGGSPVNALLGSLQIQLAIGRRSTAQFTVITDTTCHFQQYQQVAIFANGTLLFSGYITQPQEQALLTASGETVLIHSISCCDQHFLADKRIVSASYHQVTCGTIVMDLWQRILAAEGVSIGLIYDGLSPATDLFPASTLYPQGNIAPVQDVTFGYATVSQALDELVKAASLAGLPYYWQIDEYKRLWFVPYSAVSNPIELTSAQILHEQNAALSRTNPKLRNTQYLIGSQAQTAQQTETRKGDGVTRSWTLGYPLAQPPTILVNGVAQSVGIKGSDSGKSFYWTQGDATITQDQSAPILGSSDTLQVTYIGQYPIVVGTADLGGIQRQAALDGTTGIMEEVEQDTSLSSLDAALSEASQLLSRYSTQAMQIQCTTFQGGSYRPGQLIMLSLPQHGILKQSLLVESMTITDQPKTILLYQLTLIQGPYDSTWQDFFGTLMGKQLSVSSLSVGLVQSANLLAAFQQNWPVTGQLLISPVACPLPSTSTYPDTLLYPC